LEELVLSNISSDKLLRKAICILSYPWNNADIAMDRLKELQAINVGKLIFEGRSTICNAKILGKGTNSIVLKCEYKGRLAVLKVLRLDASRNSLKLEAEILKRIESLNLAPRLYTYDHWYIVEEYIDGVPISEYSTYLDSTDPDIVKRVVEKILCNALSLDLSGVDHGELSRPMKHILISTDENVYFIDFESASMSRRPKNLTSIVQYLLNHDKWCNYIIEMCRVKDVRTIYKVLGEYKRLSDPKIIMELFEIECTNLRRPAPL